MDGQQRSAAPRFTLRGLASQIRSGKSRHGTAGRRGGSPTGGTAVRPAATGVGHPNSSDTRRGRCERHHDVSGRRSCINPERTESAAGQLLDGGLANTSVGRLTDESTGLSIRCWLVTRPGPASQQPSGRGERSAALLGPGL